MDTKPDGLKIGIMGGTFDPIHYGHLMIAENAAEQFGLDQIWFMPNGNPPHKRNSNITSAEHRCAMVELAIAGNPRFTLSRREVDADGVCYTYETLASLHEECPDDRFYFIMGADSLSEFESWRNPDIICQNAVILAAVRDLTDDGALQDQIRHLTEKYQAEIFRIQTPNFSISSHRSEYKNVRNIDGRDQKKLKKRAGQIQIRTHHGCDVYGGSACHGAWCGSEKSDACRTSSRLRKMYSK